MKFRCSRLSYSKKKIVNKKVVCRVLWRQKLKHKRAKNYEAGSRVLLQFKGQRLFACSKDNYKGVLSWLKCIIRRLGVIFSVERIERKSSEGIKIRSMVKWRWWTKGNCSEVLKFRDASTEVFWWILQASIRNCRSLQRKKCLGLLQFHDVETELKKAASG